MEGYVRCGRAMGELTNFGAISDRRVSETLRLMTRPVDAKLNPDIAAEICEEDRERDFVSRRFEKCDKQSAV